MDVVLVRWPDERERREELRRTGRPRLLLLDDGSPAPTTVDTLEDWIRLPADELDVRARVQALELRAMGTGVSVPSLDEDGVLRVAMAPWSAATRWRRRGGRMGPRGAMPWTSTCSGCGGDSTHSDW
jgi:hypothetical protein